MTQLNQDFTTYAGDGATVVFTVTDGDGTPIDLSAGGLNITWTAQRDLGSAPVLSKTLLSPPGGILLVGGGTGGQFSLTLVAADTAALSGYYLHQARVQGPGQDPATVTLGRLQVGRLPVATYSGDPNNGLRDQVRFWVQDTAPPFKMFDGEIDYVLTQFTNPMLAAANCAKALAAKYAAQPSKSVGDFRISYGELVKNYRQIAQDLESQAQTFGLVPYSGGTSKADICLVNENTDRPKPPFRRDQFDNPNGLNNTSAEGWDTGPVQ